MAKDYNTPGLPSQGGSIQGQRPQRGGVKESPWAAARARRGSTTPRSSYMDEPRDYSSIPKHTKRPGVITRLLRYLKGILGSRSLPML